MKVEDKKVKEGLKKILKRFWQNLILLLVLLLVLDLVLGGFFSWKYYLKEKEISNPFPLKINQALIEKFSSTWEEKEIIFKAAEDKQYPELFRLTIVNEEEE